MKTFRIDTRLLVMGCAIGLAALSLAGAGSPLRAQELEVEWVQQEKARIGVLLEELCEEPQTAEVICERPPVVTSVVVNGPADQAGVKARDTLLSVNGLDVTRVDGRALLLDLEVGVPVELEVGRESGRTMIRVTPEMRPTEPYVDVRTVFVGPPGGLDEGAPNRVQVVRIPSVRGRLDEVELRLDSLGAGANDFVFFHQDSDGSFKIEVGDPERAHVILEQLREQEATAVRRGLLDGDSAVVIDEDRRANPRTDWRELPRYVWENEALAQRLVRVRDSSLASARVHLDSLVRLRGQVRVLGADSLALSMSVVSGVDPGGEWAYYVKPRPMTGQLRTLLFSDLRVAGAEFRQLSGDLADYFDGADEGLLVLRVIRDTPADRMGLKDGDVVVEVAGAKCSNITVLREALAHAESDETVEVKWVRKGRLHTGNLAAR